MKKIIIIGGVLLALITGGVVSLAKEDNRYLSLQLFTQVLNLVQQYYVEEVDTQKLIYGGIKGMLNELDPHTNFLPPDIYKDFQSETSGEFDGLGVEITIKDSVLTVISPIEDAPAWKAGVKAGDKIVAIDGDTTKGLSLVEAAQKMRGKTGTTVKLTIIREGMKSPKVIPVKRGKVKMRSAKYTDLEAGYAYVRLTGFMDKTSNELSQLLKEHEKKNKKTAGLILDLRSNPGGLLDQALKISDMFLADGVIVTTKGRNERQKETKFAKKHGARTDYPIVVLIDEYSASASEIVAGALQDNKRALVMGQKSFGKGSVQSAVRLGDGSGLKLTVARYYTPSGRSIQAEGIVPDIKLENLDPEVIQKARIERKVRREKDMKGHLLGEKEKKELEKKQEEDSSFDFWWASDSKKDAKNLSPKEKLLQEDFQILQAYNYLKAWKVMENQEPKAPSVTN